MGGVELILIRHGHTSGNARGEQAPMSGWTDLPLSAAGRQQARRLVARVRPLLRGARVYSSSSRRAMETAALMTDGRVPITPLDALREINCGAVDGRSLAEVRLLHPALWIANQRQDDPDFRWPGGESYREFRARCLGAMQDLAGRHPGARLLVVTHAGFISQVVGAVRGVGPAQWEAFRPANCSLTTVIWRAHGGQVVAFDDTDHLHERDRATCAP